MQVIGGVFCFSTVVLMEWITFTRRPLNAVNALGRIRNGKEIYFSNYLHVARKREKLVTNNVSLPLSTMYSSCACSLF